MNAGDGNVMVRGELLDFGTLLARDVIYGLRDGEGRDFDGIVAGFGSKREGVLQRPALKYFVANRELHIGGLAASKQMSSWSAEPAVITLHQERDS